MKTGHAVVALALFHAAAAPQSVVGADQDATSYYAAANQAFLLGEYRQATDLLSRAVKAFDGSPDKSANATQAATNLAVLDAALGEFPAAEAVISKALDWTRPATSARASVLHAWGEVLRAEGRHIESESALKDALGIYEALKGTDAPGVGLVSGTLGQVLLDMGRVDEASTILRRANTILEQSTETARWQHAAVLNSVGECLVLQRQYAIAEPVLRRALYLYQTSLGPAHPYTVAPLANMGLVLNADQKYVLAEHQLMAALKVAAPSERSTILRILAVSQWGEGRSKEAEDSLRQAYDIARTSFGDPSLESVRSQKALADFLVAGKRFEEAEKLYRNSLEGVQKLVPLHPRLRADIVAGLANLLRQEKRNNEAKLLEAFAAARK